MTPSSRPTAHPTGYLKYCFLIFLTFVIMVTRESVSCSDMGVKLPNQEFEMQCLPWILVIPTHTPQKGLKRSKQGRKRKSCVFTDGEKGETGWTDRDHLHADLKWRLQKRMSAWRETHKQRNRRSRVRHVWEEQGEPRMTEKAQFPVSHARRNTSRDIFISSIFAELYEFRPCER